MINMYIVKSAGILCIIFMVISSSVSKTPLFYRLHVKIQIRLWRGALKSQRLVLFSPREKITLLKFEIFKLTKRKQKQLHCHWQLRY